MILKKEYYLLLLILVCSCSAPISKTPEKTISKRELNTYNSLKKELKISYFSSDSVKNEIFNLKNDSLKNELFFDYAFHFYKENDSLNFRFWNNKTLELSISERDTSKIAESYWDLASFFYRRNNSDSSYYYYNKAFKFYNLSHNEFLSGMMLMNMAIIQKNIKDYVGSEVTTVKAIEKIKPLQKNRQLHMAYNNLGIVHNELGKFEKSLKYHYVALQYLKGSKDLIKEASSLNNIGVVLKNSGKYTDAVEIYKRALSIDSIYYKDPELYAMLLDNSAHLKLLLNDTLNLKDIFFRALKIRDSIDHKAGIVINKIHLSEFYLKKKDTLEAIRYAGEAKELARTSNNFRDLLKSMLLLSKIDKPNSEENLKRYITIDDSLNRRERAVRNKFARIRFETDEFIAENEYLSKERKFIIGGSVLSLGLVLLIFLNLHQRIRNKQLRLEQDQQKSNEEIYNLLLIQQNKLEEGRNREKNRISEELHDGILGNLFGTRFELDRLNDKMDHNSIITRKKQIKNLRIIEEEIRNISHDLNSGFLTSQISFLQLVEEFMVEREKIGKFSYILKNDKFIEWEKLNSKIKINLYRIIQETISNIIKYAAATNVSIIFKKVNKNILVCILDNGKGFDAGKVVKGIGLKNIESRVKSLQGTMKLTSNKEGTKIEIIIPQKQ